MEVLVEEAKAEVGTRRFLGIIEESLRRRDAGRLAAASVATSH